MKSSILAKLDHLAERYEEVGALLSDPEIIGDQNKYRELSKEYAELEPVVKCYQSFQEVVNNIEEKDRFLYPEESFCDQFSDLRYIPGAWTSPSLGRKMVDKVRDSPRLARKAMSKMTSPMVSKRKKQDEIYIVTLHVVHSSGMVGRGEGKCDAW